MMCLTQNKVFLSRYFRSSAVSSASCSSLHRTKSFSIVIFRSSTVSSASCCALHRTKSFSIVILDSQLFFLPHVTPHTEQSFSQSLFKIISCFFDLMLFLTQKRVFLNRYFRSSAVSSASCYFSHRNESFSIVILDSQLFFRPRVIPHTERSLSQSLF
jgi:hypothetical protein